MMSLKVTSLVISVVLFSSLTESTIAISQRVIYTFHKAEKTWNEARDICEDRFGQLVKLEDSLQEEEVTYLASRFSNDSVATDDIWTGSHINTASQIIYQDCLNSTTNITTASGSNRNCVSLNILVSGEFYYDYVPCSTPNRFICQRTIGDCWYRPHEDYTVAGDSSSISLTNTEATACALECRSRTEAGNECWAFTYYSSGQNCILHFLRKDRFGKAPSVAYLFDSNDYLTASVGSTLYIKVCFEGEMDQNLYEDYIDTSADPDTPIITCSNTDPDPADQLCFCESLSDPPIPAPIPVADKIEELVKELTVEASNTSAAIRKKISVEDNRPSAVGVGYVGVGLMAFVFGGLVLLDSHIVFQGIKKLVELIKARYNR